jgi:hypothetical protein
MTCIIWPVLISKQHYQQLQETFQTVVIKEITLLKIELPVIIRWKHWVMLTDICGMGVTEYKRFY